MARRRLLSPEQWTGFLAPPTDERDILRHYTLSRDDLDLIAGKRIRLLELEPGAGCGWQVDRRWYIEVNGHLGTTA